MFIAGTQAIYYRDKRGSEPVAEFIEALPKRHSAKIHGYIEEHLNGKAPESPPPGFPITSQIENEMRELRVRFASTHYRILYQRFGNLVVLLHAFSKKSGSVPAAEKAITRRRLADFKQRMNTQPRTPPRAAGQDAPQGSRRASN